MSTGYLPETITKDVLFERAKERFLSWSKMFTDLSVSVTYMYEDMSASCYCGAPKDDFPEAFKSEPVKPVKVSENEFRYRDTVFRITRDETGDTSFIWCDKYMDSDELVWWVWGSVFAGDTWLIGTDVLDKFIDSHKEETNEMV
ncbi:MAG: hypothetical protein IKQ22_00785 [Clostridia bacterium]|nr:hypothetical protein [Clostridia bacterium]